MENTEKLAVLIDADNTHPRIVDGLLSEIANYGVASVKRIYGDWTSTGLRGWKEILLHHSIQPVQQFAYTRGKNATDSAMIIDAMDLLYTGNFNGFCLVTSDSDFTRLASRIRESGLLVYGFGEKKTPSAFVTACDKFIYTEVLRAKEGEGEGIKKKSSNELKQDARLVNLLRNAVEDSSDEDGWASLGAVGSRGISNLQEIVRASVESLKEFGVKPFIIPAMGSHGGATAEGQAETIASYGITGKEIG